MFIRYSVISAYYQNCQYTTTEVIFNRLENNLLNLLTIQNE